MHSPFDSLIGAAAVISFWAFVAVSAVAGIVYDYRKKQLAFQSLQLAIEHGQNLDPAILEKLIASQKTVDPQVDPRHLTVAGIIVSFTSVGVMLLSYFISQVAPKAFYPILGAGVVVLFVGVGLLIAARYLRQTADPRA